MSRWIGMTLVLALACAAYAGDDDDKKPEKQGDPLEILKKVDAASKSLKAIKYDIEVEGLDDMKSRVPRLQATVVQTGASPFGPNAEEARFFVEGKLQMPGSDEVLRLTGGTDGDVFYIIHHDKKTAYEDIDPAVMGMRGRFLYQGMMIEYMHPTPFSDEINGKSRELRGSKRIGDEDCYEIHVVYAQEQASEATWFFSKKDFLPRCRIDHYTLPGGAKGAVRKTITSLEANPKLDESAFKLKLPEGYQKTDEFAP